MMLSAGKEFRYSRKSDFTWSGQFNDFFSRGICRYGFRVISMEGVEASRC